MDSKEEIFFPAEQAEEKFSNQPQIPALNYMYITG